MYSSYFPPHSCFMLVGIRSSQAGFTSKIRPDSMSVVLLLATLLLMLIARTIHAFITNHKASHYLAALKSVVNVSNIHTTKKSIEKF